MIVRPARSDERFAVLSLCRDFHVASGIPFAFDAAHASRAAQDHIEAPRKLCLVLEVDGALRGVLAASVAISPLSPVRIAQELVFWLDPDHRGRAAFEMLQAYEVWALSEGCVALGLSGLNDARVARFFRASGYALSENKFLKMVV
jgi:RimJ/RimL family protein N-acetyltransferase